MANLREGQFLICWKHNCLFCSQHVFLMIQFQRIVIWFSLANLVYPFLGTKVMTNEFAGPLSAKMLVGVYGMITLSLFIYEYPE